MNGLAVINQNGKFYVDSRAVAEMTEARHSDLLEKINGYVSYLLNGNFRSVDFFIESTYQDSTGRTLPCYLLTRKGCDMVANKMTGEKGVLFTAAYVTRFEEMEQQLKPQSIEDLIIMQAQSMKELRTKVVQIEATQQVIKETVISHPDNWRDDLKHMFNKIVAAVGGSKFQDLRAESYKILDDRARCDVNDRLRNLRKRMEANGETKTKINNATKLDVIEADPKLREIYTMIIKEMTIKYVA